MKKVSTRTAFRLVALFFLIFLNLSAFQLSISSIDLHGMSRSKSTKIDFKFNTIDASLLHVLLGKRRKGELRSTVKKTTLLRGSIPLSL